LRTPSAAGKQPPAFRPSYDNQGESSIPKIVVFGWRRKRSFSISQMKINQFKGREMVI
jgi:hypothetical protein